MKAIPDWETRAQDFRRLWRLLGPRGLQSKNCVLHGDRLSPAWRNGDLLNFTRDLTRLWFKNSMVVPLLRGTHTKVGQIVERAAGRFAFVFVPTEARSLSHLGPSLLPNKGSRRSDLTRVA